jgi:hypothetical protein
VKYTITNPKGLRFAKDRLVPCGTEVNESDLEGFNIEALIAGGHIGPKKITTTKKSEDGE